MKIIIKYGSVFLIGIIFCWFILSKSNQKGENLETISSHQEIVEKIEAIGKLELVRMNIKDVLEHQIVKQWLPNPKAILIIQGEAVGCIDLQQIKPEDIYISHDTLNIKLPAPEICYCKIDHSKSKVFDTQNNFFSGTELIDNAYKEAERQLRSTVIKAGILEQTKTNAAFFFRPFFESLGFKHTFIYFEEISQTN